MLKDIYLYKAMDLAQELKNGSVSEVRAVKHLIVTIIISGLGFEVPIRVAFSDLPPDFTRAFAYVLAFIIVGFISYYGVWMTYQANSKGDGRDYFLRFVSLTLPVGVQLVVIFFFVGILLAILSFELVQSFGQQGEYLSLFLSYLVSILFTALFFLRMHKHIGIAAGKEF